MENFNMNRRKFVSALGLGTAHILFSNPLFASTPGRFASNNPVQKIKLGKSGVETSLLGIGTGVHAGNRTSFLTKQDKQKSLALLQHAYDSGIRNFDCADSYGTHGIVAEALAKKDRKEYTLTSKIWVRGDGIPEPERPDANIVVDRFRKELKTDYIDIYYLHSPPSKILMDNKVISILSKFKSEGKVKKIGVSVRTAEDGLLANEIPNVDVIQVIFNIIDQRAIENGLIQKINSQNKVLISRVPLCFGFFTERYNSATLFGKNDHRKIATYYHHLKNEMEVPPSDIIESEYKNKVDKK